MSQRGIEIHNGYLKFPEGSPPEIRMGTAASPLTQSEAGQIQLSAVINALALGGDVTPAYFRVNVTVSMTGSPVALRAIANLAAAIAITGGYLRGAYISTDMSDGASAEYGWDALYISMYQHSGASSTGNTIAITIRNYMAGTLGMYYFMYMQENAAAVMEGAFYVRVVDMTNLFYLFPTVTTAWAQTGNPSNQNGWIKVSLAGNIRYLMLYSTAP